MSDDKSDRLSGEKYGITWSIDRETVQKLSKNGIDAIAEIQKALETHKETLKQSERKSDER